MVAGAWPGRGAAMGAPRQPLLGDFEPHNVRGRQSDPRRVAQLLHFLRDKRNPRGMTHLPGATQAVGEKPGSPAGSAVSFPSSPSSGPGSWTSPGFRGEITVGETELCP